MTERAGFVTSHAMTTGLVECFEGVATTYGRKGGWRSVRRVAVQNRIIGVIYDNESSEFRLEGFTSGGFTGIVPGGVTRYALASGCVAVHPKTMSGSPVSGQAFVVAVHTGKYPYVELSVPCSGILLGIDQLKKENPELADPSDQGRTVTHARATGPKPPKPHTCSHCSGDIISWDYQLASWRCYMCGWSQPIA